MVQFDAEAIEPLAAFAGEDAQDLIGRLRAMQELGSAYTSFDGKNGEGSGKVQFIVRTESIE